MNTHHPRLNELVAAIRESAKYRTVSHDLIVSIGQRELVAQRSFKEAVKATKNKLHQVAGAFVDTRPRYDDWRDLLNAAAATGDPDQLKQACLTIMANHTSTRERIPILPTIYTTVFAHLPPVHSILDLACGLNPLALPWMPVAPDVTYIACDIYSDMMAFLGDFFTTANVQGRADVCDLITAPPRDQVDLALVLKALPTLEQLDRQASLHLLRALNARHILVSFPVRSLGGRGKHMVENYGSRFEALASAEGWPFQRFEFASELAYLLTTDNGPPTTGDGSRQSAVRIGGRTPASAEAWCIQPGGSAPGMAFRHLTSRSSCLPRWSVVDRQ